MGRPPSNGGPAFRFMPNEVVEMEAILQEHHNAMPARELLVSLAEKFSESPTRKGKIVVQMKQVWNWFQNKRYAIRAKSNKAPLKLNVSPMVRDDSTPMRSVSQSIPASAPATLPAASALPGATRTTSENVYMEFEAKSARDGAWYDVATFLSHRHLDTGDPLVFFSHLCNFNLVVLKEVLVRFAGFGPDEDEWVNVRKHIRQRSLPCEASECIAVLPGDLILCFQVEPFSLLMAANEGKDQALYFDAHVLDAQRRRHDVRGCRCRFLVRYDHDQSEEIVPLRKVCRRPETDYRLQQLHGSNDSTTADQLKGNIDPSTASALRTAAYTADPIQKQRNSDVSALSPVSHTNVSLAAKSPDPKNMETTNSGIAGNAVVFPTPAALTSGTAPSTAPGGSADGLR
ncbi:Protein SAWADEE homeodomain protein 2 [Turnera subulata]|uniref:Protein SAWADEE homeodomain protein 2 n=1 Tax=Turnera subulata TaxID=218843 RepID=A0A9Q0G9Z8_9ROSI|nr:Protein SAWADEE homeodomain protein 2 [Turnera subulata]